MPRSNTTDRSPRQPAANRRHAMTRLIVGATAVLVVGGIAAATIGPVLYRDVIAAPAAPAPDIDSSTLRPSTLDLEALPTSWRLADGSFAGYRVAEVLNGTDVTVTGRTPSVTGFVTTTGNAVTSVEVTVDVASIRTDEGARDEYFRTEAIDASAHPTATFVLNSPIAAEEPLRSGTVQTVDATGTLTLNGSSRSVTVPLQAALDGDGAIVTGSLPITFADYGVSAPDLGFVSVEPQGTIEFSLRLTAPGG